VSKLLPAARDSLPPFPTCCEYVLIIVILHAFITLARLGEARKCFQTKSYSSEYLLPVSACKNAPYFTAMYMCMSSRLQQAANRLQSLIAINSCMERRNSASLGSKMCRRLQSAVVFRQGYSSWCIEMLCKINLFVKFLFLGVVGWGEWCVHVWGSTLWGRECSYGCMLVWGVNRVSLTLCFACCWHYISSEMRYSGVFLMPCCWRCSARRAIDPLKMRHSSDIWGRRHRMRI
jgi:hypothetical protein